MPASLQHLPALFPLFFVGLWAAVTIVLGVFSGWYRLMKRYPDQPEQAVTEFRRRSGTMGVAVGMKGILRLAPCPSGLRVGIMRIFGPFCRDFFVPWNEITVTRKTVLFWPTVRLEFGAPAVGSLRISANLADQLARVATGKWPEIGPFPEEVVAKAAVRFLAQWALITCLAAAFFTLVPLAVAPERARPPVLVAVLFPAIFFGLVTLVRFLTRNR